MSKLTGGQCLNSDLVSEVYKYEVKQSGQCRVTAS